MKFSKTEQQFLLDLARKSISHFLKNRTILKIDKEKLPSKKLKEKLATFVTLTKNGNLRGCIGHLTAIQPLYLDIIENAKSAAVDDFRFLEVTLAELDLIKIEISILSKPEKLEYNSLEELFEKLKNKPGVILSKGQAQATFLPQVWEELDKPSEFLSHLAEKAGLGHNEWKNAEYKVYYVENFQEQ